MIAALISLALFVALGVIGIVIGFGADFFQIVFSQTGFENAKACLGFNIGADANIVTYGLIAIGALWVLCFLGSLFKGELQRLVLLIPELIISVFFLYCYAAAPTPFNGGPAILVLLGAFGTALAFTSTFSWRKN